MKHIKFDDLCAFRKNAHKLNLVDWYQVNLDNQHHKNLHDPRIAVLSETNARVDNNSFVLTHDGLLIEDIGYREKIPNSFSVNETYVVNEPCFLLGSECDNNYYHWLLNWLPRLFLYESLNLKCKIVINKGFSERQFGVLKIFFPWISEDLLLENNQANLYSLLYVPNFFLNPLHSPRAVSLMRQRLCSLYWQDITQPKFSPKIYISRSDAYHRKIVNEYDVFEYLSSLGFEKIVLSELSLIEQVNAFYHATHIVSMHGAGLTNLVFCNYQPCVVEIINDYYTRVFWSLGVLSGASKYCMIKGRAVVGSHTNINCQDVDVDLNLLKNQLLDLI